MLYFQTACFVCISKETTWNKANGKGSLRAISCYIMNVLEAILKIRRGLLRTWNIN